jgi:hypothetical protein
MGALFQDRLANWNVGRNITLTLSTTNLVKAASPHIIMKSFNGHPSSQSYGCATTSIVK